MATFGPTATPMHLEEARMDQTRGRGKRKHRIASRATTANSSFRTEVHTLQTSPGNNWTRWTKFTGMREYLRQSPEALRACISLWKNALQVTHLCIVSFYHFLLSLYRDSCTVRWISVMLDEGLEPQEKSTQAGVEAAFQGETMYNYSR